MYTRKQINVSLIGVLLLLFSCDALTSDNRDIRKAAVLSVELENVTKDTVFLNAKASWQNGCGGFSSTDIQRDGNSYSITVYGEQEKDAICTQAFIDFDAPVHIANRGDGGYHFSFWISETSSLDTTFLIQFN